MMISVFGNAIKNVDGFLDHINSSRPSIKYSLKLEKEECLHFLDVLVQKSDIGFLTSVYRKLINTVKYIQYDSLF